MPTQESAVFGSGLSSGGTRNLAFTVTAATLLTVGVSLGVASLNPINSILTSVTWNGVAMSLVTGSVATDSSFEGTGFFQLASPGAASANVAVNVNAASQVGITAVSFIDSGLTISTPSTSNGTSANPSVTCVNSQNGDTVLAVMANDASSAITGQSGTDIGNAYVDSDSHFAGQYRVATGANTAMSWTEGSAGASWALSTIAIHGTATPTSFPPRRAFPRPILNF